MPYGFVPYQVRKQQREIMKKMQDRMQGRRVMFLPPIQLFPIKGTVLCYPDDRMEYVYDSSTDSFWKVEWKFMD